MRKELPLPQGWDEVELGTLGTFFRGRGGTRADEDAGGLPCIRYGDLYTHHDCIVRYFCSSISRASASAYTPLQHGDIVFAGSGETFDDIGRAAALCCDTQAYAGADTIVFRPSPGLDPYFAGYAVNSVPANQYKSRMGQGSSVIHISAEHLSHLRLRLPRTGEQQRIAEILSTVDEAIEQTEALIAKTQAIKAGLMYDLFTRGVTKDGQLRPPREEAPQLYKQSPLGWIPKKWETMPIDESDIAIIDGDRGVHYPQAHELLTEGHCLFLSATNVTRDGFKFESTQFISEAKHQLLGTGSLTRGDIVITTRGTVGNIAYFDEAVPFPVVRINSGMIILRSAQQGMNTAFLYCSMTNHIFVREYMRVVSGSAQPQLPIRDLQHFNIFIPSLDEQERLVGCVSTVDGRLSSERQTVAKLRSLKRGFMHDLLTGKVCVTALLKEREPAVGIDYCGSPEGM